MPKLIAPLLCLLLCSMSLTSLGGEPLPTSLAEWDARLADIAVERIRLRHEAEYGNPEIIVLREAARAIEGDLNHARQDLDAYLKINYPDEIRAPRRSVEADFLKIREMQKDEQQLQAQLDALRMGELEDVPLSEQARAVTEKLEALQAEIAEARETVRLVAVSYMDLRATVAAQDPEGKEKIERVTELEGRLRDALAVMGREVDALPAIRALDQERVYLVESRTQFLRQRAKETVGNEVDE